MKAKLLVNTAFLAVSVSLPAQKSATIAVHADRGKEIMPKGIYGQFAEHLGPCIYGGLWVGESSDIPNIKGYRIGIFNALKDLSVPVLRWPGGYFADEYHWMDGIGPEENRPKMVNNNWGGIIEDNNFGTHEFLNLCKMLGCELYVSGSVGSGTIEELARQVEYMTPDKDSPTANLRRRNGRDKVRRLKYLGVGSKSWGCGSSIHPGYYADLYRCYSTYCRNYDGNRPFKTASDASDYDYNWIDILMSHVGHRMRGLSLHYCTVTGRSGSKGTAIQSSKDDYYRIMGRCLEVGSVLKKHCATTDKYDKNKKVAFLPDERRTWWDREPGTIKGHLYQQSTLRDVFVASLSLDVFRKYTGRLKMANIAQIIDVFQFMVLTKDKEMVFTPIYYVFKVYKVHQDATCLLIGLTCEKMNVCDSRTVPMVSTTASKNKDGVIHISLSNANVDEVQETTINLGDTKAKKAVGEIPISAKLAGYNSFENPNIIKPVPSEEIKIDKGTMRVKLSTKSVVTLESQ